MTAHDTRYALRCSERTTIDLGRKLRVVGTDERPPAPAVPFGDIEIQVERDGDSVVLLVVGIPLLTGTLEEAARLLDALRSIVGRP